MDDQKNKIWLLSAGAAYVHAQPLSLAEATAEMLRLRAAWAARPEEIEKQQQHQLWVERQAIEKLAKRKNDEGVYGPPDPRTGRVPMTR